MRKIEKKITKMLEQGKIEKVINYIIQNIKEKDNVQRAEVFSSLSPLFPKIKELNHPFPDNLYSLLLKYLEKSDDWIVRRNVFQAIAVIAELFIEKVIEKDSLYIIKLKATKDSNWAVRVDGLKALGKMGLNSSENNQIIIFLSNQSEDEDPEVRMAALEALTSILKKFPEKIKPNLDIFVKRFKSDDDFRVSQAAEQSIKEFAELVKD